jgi:hypothetical protein
MKTLADFKRKIKEGVQLETFNHYLNASFGTRKVSIVQSNSFALETIKEGEKVDSWFEYPKAKDIEFIDSNTACIFWELRGQRAKVLTYKFV